MSVIIPEYFLVEEAVVGMFAFVFFILGMETKWPNSVAYLFISFICFVVGGMMFGSTGDAYAVTMLLLFVSLSLIPFCYIMFSWRKAYQQKQRSKFEVE